MSLKHYKDKDYGRKYREQYKREYRLRTGCYEHIPRRWTDNENQLILEHKIPDVELSKQINRSVVAIQVQRCKIKSKQKERKRVYDRRTNE